MALRSVVSIVCQVLLEGVLIFEVIFMERWHSDLVMIFLYSDGLN